MSEQVGITRNVLLELRQLKREVDALRRDAAHLQRQQNSVGDEWKGKTTTAHAKGATEDVQIYHGDKGSETEITGFTVSAFNTFADVADDVFVIVRFIDGGWELIRPVTCDLQNAIHDITIIGSPTGGTFDMDLTVNATTETLTFNWNDAAAAVTTELETHTQIAVGDVTVTDGPFPDATMRIEFVANLANTDTALPTLDWGALTGGSGVAVIASMAQLGIE